MAIYSLRHKETLKYKCRRGCDTTVRALETLFTAPKTLLAWKRSNFLARVFLFQNFFFPHFPSVRPPLHWPRCSNALRTLRHLPSDAVGGALNPSSSLCARLFFFFQLENSSFSLVSYCLNILQSKGTCRHLTCCSFLFIFSTIKLVWVNANRGIRGKRDTFTSKVVFQMKRSPRAGFKALSLEFKAAVTEKNGA